MTDKYRSFFGPELTQYAKYKQAADKNQRLLESESGIDLKAPTDEAHPCVPAAIRAIKLWCKAFGETTIVFVGEEPSDPFDYDVLTVDANGVSTTNVQMTHSISLPPIAFNDPVAWIKALKELASLEHRLGEVKKILNED